MDKILCLRWRNTYALDEYVTTVTAPADVTSATAPADLLFDFAVGQRVQAVKKLGL